jgi:hypothetical protein
MLLTDLTKHKPGPSGSMPGDALGIGAREESREKHTRKAGRQAQASSVRVITRADAPLFATRM